MGGSGSRTNEEHCSLFPPVGVSPRGASGGTPGAVRPSCSVAPGLCSGERPRTPSCRVSVGRHRTSWGPCSVQRTQPGTRTPRQRILHPLRVPWQRWRPEGEPHRGAVREQSGEPAWVPGGGLAHAGPMSLHPGQRRAGGLQGPANAWRASPLCAAASPAVRQFGLLERFSESVPRGGLCVRSDAGQPCAGPEGCGLSSFCLSCMGGRGGGLQAVPPPRLSQRGPVPCACHGGGRSPSLHGLGAGIREIYTSQGNGENSQVR